jgi:hypothetical protein
MRPTHLAKVVVFGAAVLALARLHALPEAQADGRSKPRTGESPASTWIVQGEWRVTQDEAVASALDQASTRVAEYLKAQQPPFVWTPDTAYIREYLLRDLTKDDVEDENVSLEREAVNGHWVLVEEKDFPGAIGTMRRVHLKVGVSVKDREDMRQFEDKARQELRQKVVWQRQTWLGKILLGVVLLLGAIAGYFRLDEATKGYYTGWLRLGVLGTIGAVGMLLWLTC